MSLTFSIDDGAISLVVFGSSGMPVATAFAFLKPTWLVTAKHVAIQQGMPRNDIQISGYKRPTVHARLLYAHPQIDVAVLELDAPICRRPLYPAHHSIASAEGLVFAGYVPSRREPEGSDTLLVSSIAGYSVEQRERDELIEEIVQFHAPESEGGNSGGPILGTNGAVVGVVIENYCNDGQRFARGTSLDPLIACLRLTQ